MGVQRAESDRIFLELAVEGCGVGCRYCYISDPERRLTALGGDAVQRSIDVVRDRLPAGPLPLLSIGCDTEVAMHRETTESAVRYLELAAQEKLPVQLSTKFPLDADVLDTLNAWPSDAPRPTIFTTITTVEQASVLEPGAPPAQERASNFRLPRSNWVSYALVKPFGPAAVRDEEALVALFASSRPDGVVVGLQYHRTPAGRRSARDLVHPLLPAWRSTGLDGRAELFARTLRAHGLRVFKTTRCVTAFHNGTAHGRVVRRDTPSLCVSCGACGSDQ